jgi:hypothetical protein
MGLNLLGVVSLGFFLVLGGVILIVTPHPLSEVRAFFRDVLEDGQGFPAPSNPHPVLYTAVMQFALIYGVFCVAILVLRFVFHDSVNRKAGTASGVVFWLGLALLANLLIAGTVGWFGFLAGLVMIVGLMTILSAVVRFLSRPVDSSAVA